MSQASQKEPTVDHVRLALTASVASPQLLHETIVQYAITDLSAFIPGGKRALIHSVAVNVDYPETLDFLLEAGADANLSDANGLTPLSMAFMYGNTTAVKTLLQAGANPESPLADGSSIQAICTEVLERRLPEYWLDKCVSIGDFVSAGSSQQTTFSIRPCLKEYPARLDDCPCTLEYGNETVDLCEPVLSLENVNLLTKLAERGAPEELGEALQRMEFDEREDYAAFLDGTGYGLIHAAVDNWKHPEMIGFLVERGADANARDFLGRGPLAGAIGSSRAEVAVALLAAGADPSLPTEMDGSSAIELCHEVRVISGRSDVCDAIDGYLSANTRP